LSFVLWPGLAVAILPTFTRAALFLCRGLKVLLPTYSQALAE
jgi:hypothetical protein